MRTWNCIYWVISSFSSVLGALAALALLLIEREAGMDLLQHMGPVKLQPFFIVSFRKLLKNGFLFLVEGLTEERKKGKEEEARKLIITHQLTESRLAHSLTEL